MRPQPPLASLRGQRPLLFAAVVVASSDIGLGRFALHGVVPWGTTVTPDRAGGAAGAGALRLVTARETQPLVACREDASRCASAGQPFTKGFHLAASPSTPLPVFALWDVLPAGAAAFVMIDMHSQAELAPGNAEWAWLECPPPAADRTTII